MRAKRLDHLLAGAAVAMALSLGGAAYAQTAESTDAGVPVPDTSLVPPPTAQDVTPATTAAAPAAETKQAEPTTTAAPAPEAAPVLPAPVAQPAPSVTPAPAVTTAQAANPLAEALRGVGTGKFDRIVSNRKDRAGVESFYAARAFEPLWIENGAWNAKGRAAVTYLGRVEADGLDSGDYPVPSLRPGLDAEMLAESEMRLTQSLLTYARHAQTGRVHYSRIAADIDYELDRPDAADVLGKLASAGNVAAVLDGLQPQHAGYRALKAQLAKSRGSDVDAPAVRVGGGPTLKVNAKKPVKDARVAALRERLSVPGDDTYDKSLADAVSAYQRDHGIAASGQLTPATVDSLNGTRKERHSDTIIANMERWRWLPRDLGRTHVMVNVPDYTLRVMKDGKEVWRTRIVVGKPSQATPVMTAQMKFITVNPTWNVPPSIIKNEYLPALAQDSTVLARMGLVVTRNRDGSVRIYQPPGERNALGRIRFNFPNKFLVYQHDTPDKNLFAHDRRAYSHGCMRVQDPAKYAEVLLGLARPADGYTADRIRGMFGRGESNINFPESIPVHLTYQTAFVDDSGKLAIREDIYGRDGRMIAAVRDEARRVADLPMDRPRPNFAAPVRSAGAAGRGGQQFETRTAPPSFFEMLFGGGQSYEAAPRRGRRADMR